MSYAQEMMKQALARVSLESESGSQGELVELDTEILNQAGEDQGELVELTTEINTAANTAVAMESLIQDFRDRKEYSVESCDQYRKSFEALIIASNMQISAASLTPSFEADKTAYELSLEAEEKTEGVLKKVWTWLLEKLNQLKELIKRIFTRAKAQEEAVAKKVETVVEELKEAEFKAEGHITLPATMAKYLVDESGRPVALSKAIGAALTPPKGDEALLKAIMTFDLAKMNAAAKPMETKLGVGSKIVGQPGSDKDNPVVGYTFSIAMPTVSGTPEFPLVGKDETLRGLARVEEAVKKARNATTYEELSKKIDSLVKAVDQQLKDAKIGRSKNAMAVRSAVANYTSNAQKQALQGFNFMLKTYLAILAYAKAAKA